MFLALLRGLCTNNRVYLLFLKNIHIKMKKLKIWASDNYSNLHGHVVLVASLCFFCVCLLAGLNIAP